MTGFGRELINIWPSHFPPLVLLLVILEFSFYPLVARVELLLPLFSLTKRKENKQQNCCPAFSCCNLSEIPIWKYPQSSSSSAFIETEGLPKFLDLLLFSS